MSVRVRTQGSLMSGMGKSKMFLCKIREFHQKSHCTIKLSLGTDSHYMFSFIYIHTRYCTRQV